MGRIKPTLILGGPGCGKTTALLKIVEEAFAKGVAPDRIAYVAFTRKAAQEARTRMAEKFGIESDDIPYFRTLHSFAFRYIDAKPAQILDGRKLREYAKAEGLDLSDSFIDEFGQSVPLPITSDDRAFSAIAMARLTERDLGDVAGEMDCNMERVREIAADFEEFKDEAAVFDFTDMLTRFVNEATLPEFDLLIVDEAQDLSRLQWRMVDRLIDHSRDVYFAGDDDQAIYAWAGADIEHFLTLDADREILPTSYRLKSEVFTACQKVIAHCNDRYEKDWSPHAQGGLVTSTTDLLKCGLDDGTWYVLARTNSLVRSLAKQLRSEGYAFNQPTAKGMQSSVAVDPVQAVLIYENLRKGGQFTGDKMQLCWSYIDPRRRPEAAPVFDDLSLYGIDDLCRTGFVADASWLDALSLTGAMRTYIRMLRAKGESLIKEPRITVSTIHGVKGGEADNVVIWQKLTGLTYKSWLKADPQEYRTLFTAMSRAREQLIFLDTRSKQQYNVERLLI